ncbi:MULTISPECIES: flagellar assembly protein FlgT [unclassified Marinobacter]|uniref:flagellar assembly protein FlgT n=1 Tax=unclassified Marinobacter TaxID=83889 RepID=UPI00200FCD61|nr:MULTISPECIES: flagellar assembly protein FlgT [unclassified Marinobacter]UQG55301.1 flagellar assembly protein FlgT [Marinobacter sp. M4C]UQG64104.1 flagellar assembly protein FlgT [Marinobacter sp. M2C]UQG68388.1 flagellar assembly protein FlgT [Marinobacter sp. M1C]
MTACYRRLTLPISIAAACALVLALVLASQPLLAAVVEGIGHASIHNGDIDSARALARQAALRDMALQYDARISNSDTVENGVLTSSRLRVTSDVRARNVQVVDEFRSGQLLRVTLRAEMTAQQSSCGNGAASTLKKRVAITGFPLLYPDHARVGRLDDAGEMLPQQLQARLRNAGSVQVLSATSLRMYGDLLNAPTAQQDDNRLTNVRQLARELGAQFVVSGVIRDLDVADPAAWNTSVFGKLKRGLNAVDQTRRFIADMVIYDGFSGAPVYQQRFSARAQWNAGPGSASGFASAGFEQTDYGKAVAQVMDDMARSVTDALNCQPFMTRISRVDGELVTIESGATSGLRPSATLQVYRSAQHFEALDATPELTETGVNITLNNVHPEFASGKLSAHGGQTNVQQDDIAVVW